MNRKKRLQVNFSSTTSWKPKLLTVEN
jgi:hypothetical protein